MQKREIKRLDQFATNGRGKARKTAKHGRKGYSKKSVKASSQSRKGGGRADGKKRQKGTQQTAYKIADLLSEETIKKLKERARNG